MALKSRVQQDMKAAMRVREKTRLGTLRMLMAAIKQREIDTQQDLDDAGILSVVEKMVKQRRESMASYTAAGRSQLAADEEAEIQVLQAYLPDPLSEEEIDTLVARAISETDATGMKDMGQVMQRLKPQVQSRAEMSAVSQRVKSQLGAD